VNAARHAHRPPAPRAAARRGLLVLGAALLLLGLGIGSTGFESLLSARHDPVALQIVWDIRLPRTLGAWLAGALLGWRARWRRGCSAIRWPIPTCWAAPRAPRWAWRWRC
jgi:hypothetical protein